jgi:RNA polymerase sigma-70 factor (ECF subfamily)
VKLHERHLRAQRRTVSREHRAAVSLSDESALDLAQHLLASGTSPSNRMMKAEQKARVRAALTTLPPRDREVLVMRYLEELTTSEIAQALAISEGAVKLRHLRALERLRNAMTDECVEEDER